MYPKNNILLFWRVPQNVQLWQAKYAEADPVKLPIFARAGKSAVMDPNSAAAEGPVQDCRRSGVGQGLLPRGYHRRWRHPAVVWRATKAQGKGEEGRSCVAWAGLAAFKLPEVTTSSRVATQPLPAPHTCTQEVHVQGSNCEHGSSRKALHHSKAVRQGINDAVKKYCDRVADESKLEGKDITDSTTSKDILPYGLWGVETPRQSTMYGEELKAAHWDAGYSRAVQTGVKHARANGEHLSSAAVMSIVNK